MDDNFNINLVGQADKPFLGYVSSKDKTSMIPQLMVRGSKNVYKKLSGTIANRPGLKRRGAADATIAGVVSAFVWNNSLGKILPLRVANNKLQVESDIVTPGTFLWYDLMTSLTQTRAVFDTYWDNTNKKDKLLFVLHDPNIYDWSGGLSQVSGGTATAAGTITALDTAPTAGGSGYALNDTATINGGTATIKVTGVTGGAVTSVVLISPGSGYSVGSGTATTATIGVGTGLTVNITAIATAGTITKLNSTTTWAQDGFAPTGTITIGGVDYVYTSGYGSQILTVTSDASALVSGAVGIAKVVTVSNTPAAGALNDFIRVVNNQLYVGSYTSRLVYISDQTDYTDFSIPTPRIPGSPELIICDGAVTGIGQRQGKAHIFAGTAYLHIVTFTSITVGSALEEETDAPRQDLAEGESCYAHEFIATVGDDLIYLSQNQQLLVFGTFRNMATPRFPSLSQAVFDELQQEDFTGGELSAIGDFLYLTAPLAGRTWLHQTRYSVDSVGNIVSEKLWHPPQIWNGSRIVSINAVEYVHSNSNPQIYQIWNTAQWHDDSPNLQVDGINYEYLSYDSVMRLAYVGIGDRREGLIRFDKLYTEGYITPGTNLNAYVLYNYQGSSLVLNPSINSIASPATLFTGNQAPSLGDSSISDNPLGDGLTVDANDQELLPKFKAINNLTLKNCFEYQLVFYSTDIDSRWEILCTGTNAVISNNQQATFLRKAN